tara:strand:- start:44 stop:2293 length:2250 start_codon:yes stop_codon:yes gene_type:complete
MNVRICFKIIFTIILLNCTKVFSNEILIEINGNNFTDRDVIISLIKDKPTSISQEYSDYIIKTLNNSMLFESVTVTIDKNKYLINIKEFPSINKIYFRNNERFDDDELFNVSRELDLINLNPNKINIFIDELSKVYESFGYNNIEIIYSTKIFKENNTADIYFEIIEGELTKIKNIYFEGNSNIDNEILKSLIKSKTKSLINIFANNNFKKFTVIDDTRKIKNYYINSGFKEIKIDYLVEYLKANQVNIYFKINEGDLFTINEINILDQQNILNQNQMSNLKDIVSSSLDKSKTYSVDTINNISSEISDTLIADGLEFFEIQISEIEENQLINYDFNIIQVEPKYTYQINIYGNTRTFDRVIRRELEISEGDAIYKSHIDRIQKKIRSLRLFDSVEIKEKIVDDKLVNLEIYVEEKQTGTVNAGVSFGSLDGVGVVLGLNERNFYGTGRSVKAILNTTQDKTQFLFETTDRLPFEENVNITYRSSYKQEDFSVSKSYKLDTFFTGVGLSYKINPKLRHSIDLDYLIKNYKISDSSSVSPIIGKSSGENISFVLVNNFTLNKLNSILIPKNGTYFSYINSIETPSSSNNGLFKNIITYKKYKKNNKNIFSFQSKLGNIISLNDNDVLSDNKFSLGGRWLRGFDSFGAGPRNSRTSYVGGNNLIATKLDYSRELSNNSDFPLFLNFFNDYGLVWDNKTKPTFNDTTIRSSVGFGLKYYSAIGPIGFSWGFPIQDESYDIKRMFLFSIGNID